MRSDPVLGRRARAPPPQKTLRFEVPLKSSFAYSLFHVEEIYPQPFLSGSIYPGSET
jgi:hypothetical protein